MAITDITLGHDATAANNLKLRADGAGGGSICNGAGTELVKVPAGGVPAFRAYATGVTSVTNSIPAIALANDSTAGLGWDTTNAFDTGTSRFTPQVAGYYQINGKVSFSTVSYVTQVYLYKNGSLYATGSQNFVASQGQVSDLIYLNGTTDYVDLRAYSATTQNSEASGPAYTCMSGFLARAT